MDWDDIEKQTKNAREGKLYHSGMGESEDAFFQRIDALGGWPPGKAWVTMDHSDARLCFFTDKEIRTGWKTSIYCSDDYYIWKLSPGAILKIKQQAAREISSSLFGFYGVPS